MSLLIPLVFAPLAAYLVASIANGYAGWNMVRAMLALAGAYSPDMEEGQPTFWWRAFWVLLVVGQMIAWTAWWLA